MHVVTSPEGEFAALGEELAREHDCHVTTDPTELDDGPVLGVFAPNDLDEQLLAPLKSRLAERGPADGAFGVLTGHRATDARALYERDRQSNEGHYLALRQVGAPWESSDDSPSGPTILTGDDVSAAELDHQLAHGASSLGFGVPGRSIHLTLTDGFVCGVPSNLDEYDLDGPQPFCLTDDSRNCPYDETLVAADDLDADHVFLNACTSVLPSNTSAGLPAHLGVTLLKSAKSLIGCSRAGPSIPQEAVLHYALVQAGYTTAERCYVLNKNARRLGVQYDPYVPFGAPWRSTDATAASFEYATTRTPNGTRIDVTEFSGTLLDVRLPADGLPPARDAVLNRVDADGSVPPLYYTLFREGGRLRVLVYSHRPFEADHLRFRVTRRTPTTDWYQMAAACLRNVRSLEQWGILHPKVGNQANELASHLNGVADYVSRQQLSADVHRKVKKRLLRCYEGVTNIEDSLVSSFRDRQRGHRLADDLFARQLSARVDDPGVDCPYCGRSVFTRSAECVYSGDVRVVGICPACYEVFHVPHGDRYHYPTLSVDGSNGPVRVPADDTVTFDVAFENPRDRTARVVLAPTVHEVSYLPADDELFTPVEWRGTLAAGETRRLSVEFDASRLPENEYRVELYALADLDVFQGSREVIVGGDVSYRAERVVTD